MINILEFCKECGVLMMPFEDNNTKVLKCKACGKIISFNKELIKSYNFITIIDHSMIDK